MATNETPTEQDKVTSVYEQFKGRVMNVRTGSLTGSKGAWPVTVSTTAFAEDVFSIDSAHTYLAMKTNTYEGFPSYSFRIG
jgi:hypothetical protein